MFVCFYLLQHKTIDSVLARGEKLDSLVEKSSDLSAASQVNVHSFVMFFLSL
jgi:synaptobrevin family protein YKT6